MRRYKKNIAMIEKHTYAPELNKVVFKNNKYIDLKDFEKLEKIKKYDLFFKYAIIKINCQSYDKLDNNNNKINFSEFTDIKQGIYNNSKELLNFIKELKIKNGVSENFKKVILNAGTDREIIYYRKINITFDIKFRMNSKNIIKFYNY